MKTYNSVERRYRARRKLTAALTAAVLAFTVALSHAAKPEERIVPPIVPEAIDVGDGYRPFLIAHAIGTQNYICQLVGSSLKWVLVGPQATLFNDEGQQILTHYLSPNPLENGAPRATWQHSKDTSAAWAVKVKESADPAFVAPDAIPWFLLDATGTQEGFTGGNRLTRTEFIQRVNTVGGKEPATGCSIPDNINARQFVSYEADYVFYKYARDHSDK
jgi:Protein of unknown function (DUF3455)